MSRKELKRDRRSRNEFQEDFDSSMDELTDSFSESLDRITDDFEQSVSSKPELPDMDEDSLVDDSDEEEEGDRVGLLSRLTSIGRFLPVRKIGGILWALPSLIGKAGRLLLHGGKKSLGFFAWLGSFLIFRGDDDEEEEGENVVETQAGESVAAKAHATREIPKLKPASVSKTDYRKVEDDLADDTDFEERAGWSWKFKAAALAALILVGTGGYFVLKPLLFSDKEIADASAGLSGSASPAESGVKNGNPETPPTPKEAKTQGKIAANVSTPDPKDPKAIDSKPVDPKAVANAKKPDPKAPKADDPKPVDPKAVANAKKPDPKDSKVDDSKPVDPKTVANAKKPDPKDPKAADSKPVDPKAVANAKKPDPKDSKAADSKPVDSKTVANAKKPDPKSPKVADPKPVDPKAVANAKKPDPKDPKAVDSKPVDPKIAAAVPDGAAEPIGSAFFQPAAESSGTSPSLAASDNDPFAMAFSVVPLTQTESKPEAVESVSAADISPLSIWNTVGPAPEPEKTLPVAMPEGSMSPPKLLADTVPPPEIPAEKAPANDKTATDDLSVPKMEDFARFAIPKTEEKTEQLQALDSIGAVPSLESGIANLAPLEPLGPDFVAAIPPEPSLSIPDDKITQKFRAEEFRAAPTPRNVDVSIPKLEIDDSIAALDRPPAPEIIPAIPSSGNVKHVAAAPPVSAANVEPSLSIPDGSFSAASASFTDPKPVSNTVSNAVNTLSIPEPTPVPPPQSSALSAATPAPETPFYVPPSVDRSTPRLASAPAPETTVSAADAVPVPEIATAPFVTETGPSVGIPRNELQPLTTGNLEPLTTVQTVATAPIHPDHEALAKTDPPFGSQFQQRTRELRDSNSETPRLNFGDAKEGGATRFNRQASTAGVSTEPQLLAVPTATDDPNSNALFGLNPTGKAAVDGIDRTTSLPPDSASPRAVLASGHPGYGRSVPQDVPATVSVGKESDASLAPALADRASTYRARIEKEITQSPEETEMYTVREGDTYMTISDRKYSTSLLYRALAVHNKRRGVDWVPPPGTVIEIPTAEYLKTNYAEVLMRSGNERRTRTSNNTGLNRTTQIGGRYTTREGDSVFRIATNQLRDSSRWQEILDLNSDRIQSPTKIPAGVELVLPVVSTASHSAVSTQRR